MTCVQISSLVCSSHQQQPGARISMLVGKISFGIEVEKVLWNPYMGMDRYEIQVCFVEYIPLYIYVVHARYTKPYLPF